jgi:hypothetical protein
VLGAVREAHGDAVHALFQLTAEQAREVLRTGQEARPNFARYSYCDFANNQPVIIEYVSPLEDGSPQWASSREIQKPRVNTALVINVSTRKYSNIFPVEKIFCANRTAR